jgi:hypothetical protein
LITYGNFIGRSVSFTGLAGCRLWLAWQLPWLAACLPPPAGQPWLAGWAVPWLAGCRLWLAGWAAAVAGWLAAAAGWAALAGWLDSALAGAGALAGHAIYEMHMFIYSKN